MVKRGLISLTTDYMHLFVLLYFIKRFPVYKNMHAIHSHFYRAACNADAV